MSLPCCSRTRALLPPTGRVQVRRARPRVVAFENAGEVAAVLFLILCVAVTPEPGHLLLLLACFLAAHFANYCVSVVGEVLKKVAICAAFLGGFEGGCFAVATL